MSQAFGGGGKSDGGDTWLTLACNANGSCERFSFPGLGGAGGPLPGGGGACGLLLGGGGACGLFPGGGGACCPNLLNKLRRDSWYDVDASALALLEFLCGVGGGFFSGELMFAGGRGGGGGVTGKPSDGGGGNSAGCQRGLVLTAGGGGDRGLGGSGAWKVAPGN